MRKRYALLLLMLLFVFFVAKDHQAKQNVEWKGKIEVENGINIITNPEEPQYGVLEFDLKEDLAIGKSNEDRYLFNRIWDLHVDDKGNIFVMDNGRRQVNKYDEHGNYIFTASKKDPKTGYSNPRKILLGDESGKLYVLNFDGGINIYDQTGQYLGEIRLKNKILDISAVRQDTVWGIVEEVVGETFAHRFCSFNTKGDIIKEVQKFPYEVTFLTFKGQKRIFSSTGLFNLVCSRVNSTVFVYGYSGRYQLSLVNGEGGLLFRIRRNAPLKMYPEKTIRNYKEKGIIFPDHEPLFYSIFSDSEGRIYVRREESNKKENKAEAYDVFNKDGIFLYKTSLPYKTYAIKNGYLYQVCGKEGDPNETVKRFKILNWTNIKN